MLGGHLRPRDRRDKSKRNGPCLLWEGIVDDPAAHPGKRKQLSKTFRGSKREALRAFEEWKHAIRRGTVARDPKITVRELGERWLKHVAAPKEEIDPDTIKWYRYLFGMHVNPVLGNVKLGALARSHVQNLVDMLLESGNKRKGREGEPLSVTSVRHIRRTFAAALDYALQQEWISINPAAGVRLKGTKKAIPTALDDDQARRLIAAALGTRLHLLILIAATTGMRRGEMLALMWESIDFEKGEIEVRWAMRKDRTLKRPKTERSRRTIEIPGSIMDALRLHKDAQDQMRSVAGDLYQDRGFVFAEEDGSPWLPDGISTLYRRIVKDAGVPRVRFHDLRHSAASILVAAGVPMPVVSEILGHAHTGTTAKIYAHALKKDRARATEVMEKTASITA